MCPPKHTPLTPPTMASQNPPFYYRVECEIGPDGAPQPEQRLTIAVDADIAVAYKRCTTPADPDQWHMKLLWAVRKEFEDGAQKVLVSYSDPLQPASNKVTFYMYRQMP